MKLTKILLSFFVFILILAFASSTYAMTILKANEGSGNVKVESGEVINDNVITVGNVVVIRGEVINDVVVFGQKVKVEGVISGNLIVGANEIEITGRVVGDVYAGASSITISENAVIERDLVAGASIVNIEGKVGRNVWVGSADFNIAGVIGGDIAVGASQIKIADSASVAGKLNYYAEKETLITNQNKVLGGVDFHKTQTKSDFGFTNKFVGWIMGLIMAMIAGCLLLIFFPKKIVKISEEIKSNWLKSLGVGILFLTVVPIIAIICMILIVGLPIGLILFAVYFILLYLAKFWLAFCLGNSITKKKLNPYWTMILGIIILYLLYLIPYVGPVVAFIVILIGLGGLYLSKPMEGEK